MTTYEKFKQALFKASPELEKDIKELKFGCLVKTKCCGKELEGKIYRITADGKFETKWGFFREESLNVEIIGRDITLEDVFISLEDNEKIGDYMIENGYFVIYKFETENGDILFSWKLGKSAEEQSSETLISLIKLLK